MPTTWWWVAQVSERSQFDNLLRWSDISGEAAQFHGGDRDTSFRFQELVRLRLDTGSEKNGDPAVQMIHTSMAIFNMFQLKACSVTRCWAREREGGNN